MRTTLCALLALVAASCTVGRKQVPVPDLLPIVEGQTTKREVLERFGVPDEVFYPAGRQLFLYTSNVERGMGIGAGYLGITLSIGHTHVGTDTAAVLFDTNGIVERVRLAKGSELARYDIWPFGE